MTECVYFLRAVSGQGAVKIGHSHDAHQRLESFMRWSPVPLEIVLTIPGTLSLESNIHGCFADDHSHGEWFNPSPRLLTAIAEMQEGKPVSEAIDLADIRGNVKFMIAERSRLRNGSPTSWESRRANAKPRPSLHTGESV